MCPGTTIGTLTFTGLFNPTLVSHDNENVFKETEETLHRRNISDVRLQIRGSRACNWYLISFYHGLFITLFIQNNCSCQDGSGWCEQQQNHVEELQIDPWHKGKSSIYKIKIFMFKWIEVGMNEKIDYIILFQFNRYPYKYPLSNLSR